MRTVTYTLTVTATAEVTDDGLSANYMTEAYAVSPEQRRAIEQQLHACLRRFDYDADCELVNVEVSDDDPHGASCSCETCQMERAADTALEV